MKYKKLPTELFLNNRARFTKHMKPNSIAIFHSNDMMPRNGDQYHDFRQNSDLFALCGMDQEESVLILYPDCIKPGFQEVLFLRKTNEYIKIWEGHKYTKEEAKDVSGIQKVYWTEDMDSVLNELILMADHIYVNTNENDRFNSAVPSRDARYTALYKERYPAHNFLRSQQISKRIAMVKNKYEVDAIQEAIDITEKAFRRILKFVKPGVMEYEIEAEMIHEFIRNRATGHAFHPIIASGENACCLHYNDNNDKCKKGEIILMDFGAEYANYNADCTRSYPVSGKYSRRQKAVYNAVLRVHNEAREMLRPGVRLQEYEKEVGKIMTSELIGLGLISASAAKRAPKDRPAYKKYFMHGTSHHLGLDVHDLMDRYAVIEPNMVYTVEPGIYIPEEKLGIRIENDVLTTNDSPKDLMKNIPIEAAEIEEIMNSKR